MDGVRVPRQSARTALTSIEVRIALSFLAPITQTNPGIDLGEYLATSIPMPGPSLHARRAHTSSGLSGSFRPRYVPFVLVQPDDKLQRASPLHQILLSSTIVTDGYRAYERANARRPTDHVTISESLRRQLFVIASASALAGKPFPLMDA